MDHLLKMAKLKKVRHSFTWRYVVHEDGDNESKIKSEIALGEKCETVIFISINERFSFDRFNFRVMIFEWIIPPR